MTKPISQLSKAELLEEIIKQGLDHGKDVAVLKRREMIEMFQENKNPVEDAVVEDEGETEIVSIKKDQEEEKIAAQEASKGPDIHSPEWTSYVMSLLRDDEKEGQSPKCDGLRRVFEIVIGPILECTTQINQIPYPENGNRATAVVTIKYLNNRNNLGYAHVVSDAADVCMLNTRPPFCNYPTATATTIAEGRCLRKIMRLNVILREEVKDAQTLEQTQAVIEASEEQRPSNDNQRNTIKRLAERNKINFTNMIKDLYNTTIDLLSYKEAQEVFHKLNNYQRGEEAVPEEYKIK